MFSRIPMERAISSERDKLWQDQKLMYIAMFYPRVINLHNFFLAIEQNLPEDICFYRDGEVWLYTVTHERSATMVSSTSLDFDFLKSYFI